MYRASVEPFLLVKNRNRMLAVLVILKVDDSLSLEDYELFKEEAKEAQKYE